jgi:hypothetical protein
MKKQKPEKSHVLPLLLLFLSAFFIFLFLIPEAKKPVTPEKTNVRSKEFEARVNRHLFETSQKMEHSRERMEIEASQANTNVQAVQEAPEAKGVDLSVDPRAEALVQALGRDVKEPSDPKNPHELIQAELFEQEKFSQYSEEYKREYARQFIENAKKAGYIVKLNSDYKVISVTPVRNPAQDFKIFDAGGGSAQ